MKIWNAKALVENIESLTATSPGNFECDLIYEDLTLEEKATYDSAMTVIVQDSICTVDNTPYDLDIQRMTSSAINVGVDEITEATIDYTTLSAADKAKLDAFNQLLIDKCW
jgi:hypothetical protein